jgi:predicted  nucleic acid-binding Zn-ribbon protein
LSDQQALLALQDLDTRADQLRHRQQAMPERAALADLEKRGRDLRGQRAEIIRQRDELAGREHDLAKLVEADQKRRNDIEKRLKISTVPKEVQALSDELATLGHHTSELEDREMELMEAIEPLETQLAQLDVAEVDMDTEGANLRMALAENEVSIETELKTVAQERERALGLVPATLLKSYETLRPKLGGVAIARLDNGRCTGCHLQLPATELDRLRHEPADALVNCEQCGRILVR